MKRVTNGQVAKDLGISESMASRLRSGDRMPGWKLMKKIEEVYRWKFDRQVRLHGTPEYSTGFERSLCKHHGVEWSMPREAAAS